MSLFAVEYTYNPETSSGRDDHRTDHRAWLDELVRRHVVRSMHPLADGSGAVIIVDAEDADSVARLFRHDPFSLADLVENVRISEWTPPIDEFSS
ncbi:YciI family protein [Rhodococcus marinonascens]|uniref:YciI family protein n=1 Tax=Rhodococcus marinonascens TaxID=38311 RepID=UPI0009341026|nr:YciI family protein [Rhodococcus marinonascens]